MVNVNITWEDQITISQLDQSKTGLCLSCGGDDLMFWGMND